MPKENRYGFSAALTTDGNYTPPSTTASSTGIQVDGGRYEFVCLGTPNGATCAVHVKSAGQSAFYAVADVAYVNAITDASHEAPEIEFAVGDIFYIVISNDGASTSLTPSLHRLEH